MKLFNETIELHWESAAPRRWSQSDIHTYTQKNSSTVATSYYY